MIDDVVFLVMIEKVCICIEMEVLFKDVVCEGVKMVILCVGDFYGMDKVGIWFD